MKPPVLPRRQLEFTDRQLWEKYWMVTQELLKLMKALPVEKQDFRHTEECAQLKEQIKPLDMQIMYKARTWLNKSRRNNTQVRAYDGIRGVTNGSYSFNRQL